jgi:hypothetical protein
MDVAQWHGPKSVDASPAEGAGGYSPMTQEI